MITVAIDIGGTFTDLVGFDDKAQKFVEAKSLTTPHELTQGILDCIRKSGLAAAAILKAPRPAILGVKEYVKSAPDMAVFGAVEFARNLHATVNSSHEMRRKH